MKAKENVINTATFSLYNLNTKKVCNNNTVFFYGVMLALGITVKSTKAYTNCECLDTHLNFLYIMT